MSFQLLPAEINLFSKDATIQNLEYFPNPLRQVLVDLINVTGLNILISDQNKREMEIEHSYTIIHTDTKLYIQLYSKGSPLIVTLHNEEERVCLYDSAFGMIWTQIEYIEKWKINGLPKYIHKKVFIDYLQNLSNDEINGLLIPCKNTVL